MATLRLALRDGFEAVTTDMISAEAGISPRTFFNYFPNKEAALIGPASELDCETIDWFAQGRGSIAEDFLAILDRHFAEEPPERELLRGLHLLRTTSPQLELVFARTMTRIMAQTSEGLQRRLGSGSSALADLLAATLTQSVTTAMSHWVNDEEATVADLLTEVRRLLTALAKQLNDLSAER